MGKVLQVLVILFLLVGTGAACFGLWVWDDLHKKTPHQSASTNFDVSRGERLDQILQDLHERGILEHILPLRLYLKITKNNPVIRAGAYTFPSPITPLEVLQRLKEGGDFKRITVIEGWSRFEIADALLAIPSFKLKDRKQALALMNNTKLISDIDKEAKNLEGYLFPDTYFIDSDTTAAELVKQMVGKFREVWGSGLSEQAAKRGRTAHFVVTEASIIQTEAKLSSDRPMVASVVENRVKEKMTLSMDSTLIYAAKLAGKWKNDGMVYQSDIDRVSPYNTRLNKGLPPGPIASPGRASLEAAVNPISSNYIYYVRNPDRNDGAHNFYSTAKSFEAGVQALRMWEKKHPATSR